MVFLACQELLVEMDTMAPPEQREKLDLLVPQVLLDLLERLDLLDLPVLTDASDLLDHQDLLVPVTLVLLEPQVPPEKMVLQVLTVPLVPLDPKEKLEHLEGG